MIPERRKGYGKSKRKFPAWVWMTAAVCLLTLLISRASGMTAAAEAKKKLSDSVLRFHVTANSDSREDQELKLKVRDAVITELEPLLEQAEDLSDTEAVISEHLEALRRTAEETIREAGYSYGTEVFLTNCYFPEKRYGDTVFPAGRYDALRVTIGKAAGQNWWCLLFPAVCFTDCVRGVFPREQQQALKNILTEEEFESLFSWKNTNFKICTKFSLPF